MLVAPARSAASGQVSASTNSQPLGLYKPVTRFRALDTRSQGGIAPGSVRRIQIAGRGPVPARLTAVSVNLTVLTPSRTGSLSAYPDGSYVSGSTMSFQAGQTIQNAETVPDHDNGYIDIRNNSAGLLTLVVDILGYYDTDAPQSGWYQAMSPTRVLDTRTTALGAGQSRTFKAVDPTGVDDFFILIPTFNVTVLTPSRSGSLSVWASGVGTPSTPSLTFTAGQTEQSQLTMGLDAHGSLSVRNNSAAPLQVVLDQVGVYGLVPAYPSSYDGWGGYARSYDSRAAGKGPIPPGGVVRIPVQQTLVAHNGGQLTFSGGLVAVSMNVTVLTPAVGGSVSVWPTGSRESAATISFATGHTRQRMLLAAVGSSSAGAPATVELRNNTAKPLTVIVDLNGWAEGPWSG
ncbi:MAG TPA: hypothetical protein VGX49_09380 [Jatrophihabitans sp.]|nr:hypothetical protein [Jatrophihabitans sp.]